MKNRYGIVVLLLLSLVGLSSCSKNEDLGGSNIEIPTQQKSELDTWLFDIFVKPLNIEVKYLWDDSELDLDKKLVPADMTMVKPFMDVVNKVWIEPYTDPKIVPDASFLKRLCPKQLVLVGSSNFNSDGTVTLGTAEGGRKIVLYEINAFNKANKDQVLQMLHTLQHEFAHILHQNKMYPEEFKKITTGYTSTWFNIADEQSNLDGFITSYARSSTDEDFVEMVAAMLTVSKTEFDTRISKIKSVSARAALRAKEAIVASYFMDTYNIDIYALQQRIVVAMNALNAPVI